MHLLPGRNATLKVHYKQDVLHPVVVESLTSQILGLFAILVCLVSLAALPNPFVFAGYLEWCFACPKELTCFVVSSLFLLSYFMTPEPEPTTRRWAV